MGPPTGLSQEHNLCLVTDTSAARSSAPLPARDVRDEPELSPARRAHPTRLLYPSRGLRSQARRSPPTPDLLRRARPVNRGAVGGRVQLDGRRLLLGHSGPGKALLTPRGGRPLSCFLPLSCPTPAAQGQVGATGPGAAFGGRAPRGPFSAEGPLAVSGDPRPTRPGLGLARKESKGFPGGAARQRGIPSLFSSVNRSLGFDRHRHSPAPASAWKVQPPPAPCPPLRAAVPGREWRAEEGRGRGKASPLHPDCCVSHTPTRLRPYGRADSQWKHASAADDAEIRHGGAARCPGGGVRLWLHSALCCPAALR